MKSYKDELQEDLKRVCSTRSQALCYISGYAEGGEKRISEMKKIDLQKKLQNVVWLLQAAYEIEEKF